MNLFLEKALKTQHDRRPAFERVLAYFSDKPIKVLVVGGERATTPESIYGDGFFSLYAADYIKKNGGKLVIVDIDPKAIPLCREIMTDFPDTVIICDDGLKWIENEDWDLVYLDGDDDPNSMYEQFKKVNLTKTAVFCDDFHGKGVRLRQDFKDFQLLRCNHIHEMAFYPKVEGNRERFKIGSMELEYVRERPNRAWYNERSLELGLAQYFSERFVGSEKLVEIGDVSYQYSYFWVWDVIDCAPVYEHAIRKSVLSDDVDLKGKEVLSISTLEHVGEGAYNDGKNAPEEAIKALIKVIEQAEAYLITIPLGANLPLQDYIINSNVSFTLMRRENPKGAVNNWVEEKNIDYLQLPYGHFSYGLSYYGNALAVLVLTNLPELQ